MKILETKRLLLRHLELEDLQELFALYCDPQVIRYIPDAPTSLEETREELLWHLHGHPAHPGLGLWAAVLKETGKFIGRCGLLPWDLDGREEVEVAFLIGREYWGQGLGTEAAQAILQYGFEVLDLPRLVCLIEPGNQASIRVAGKIGMRFEREGRDEMGSFFLYSRNRTSDPFAVSRTNASG